MSNPILKEITESINELTAYRNRLRGEIEMLAKKLRIKTNKIDSNLNMQMELNQIEEILKRLEQEKEKYLNDASK